MKVGVSERALVARVRRHIMKKDGARLIKNRRGAGYYCANDQNTICGPGIENIEAYARENGLLKPFEEVCTGMEPQPKEATMEEIIGRLTDAARKLIEGGAEEEMRNLATVLERKVRQAARADAE